MKNVNPVDLTFEHISDLMRRLRLRAPLHPLITLVNYDKEQPDRNDSGKVLSLDFYKISFKHSFTGSIKYGPGSYDFKEGGLAFVGPRQLVTMSADEADYQGYALYFHPALLQGHPLAKTIRHRYGFFSYAVAEALFLSEKEKTVISALFGAIATELENNLDHFSTDVLLSQIELLLNHSNRFYNRQFLTRKHLHHDLIDRMDIYLAELLNTGEGIIHGTPSARQIAEHLNVSQRYLSDMLRSLTGMTTQQHIHLHLIQKAKELLSSTAMTTGEIAYRLGFEHPQSFNKLFKQKTNMTPAGFRGSAYDQEYC